MPQFNIKKTPKGFRWEFVNSAGGVVCRSAKTFRTIPHTTGSIVGLRSGLRSKNISITTPKSREAAKKAVAKEKAKAKPTKKPARRVVRGRKPLRRFKR